MVFSLWVFTNLLRCNRVILKDLLCSDFCFFRLSLLVENSTSTSHARHSSWSARTSTSTIWMTSSWTLFSKLAVPLRWSSKTTIHLHLRSSNSRWLSIHQCLTQCNKAVNLLWWPINTKWRTLILTNSSIKSWLQINNNSSLLNNNTLMQTWHKLLNSSYRWDRDLMQICPLKSEHRYLK